MNKMPPTEAEVIQAVKSVVPKPPPNPRNNATMFKIFQNVQHNVLQHKKYVKEMKHLYKKLDEDTFRESFRNALHYLFKFGDPSANVDRTIQFIATFCTSLDEEDDLVLYIFEIIFNRQCLFGQSLRFRASQLLAEILSAMGDDASLDDDLCDKLLESQLQRLQDARSGVRCRAALALQRLQNPNDPTDEVTRAYRFHMSCDPNSSVRRAIVMSIARCTRNVPFVLERLRDVDESVRRAAFVYIAAINVTQLKVKQRLFTLKVGLMQRSPRVRRVVEEILIPGWLSTFQGNIIDLLKAIRLDNAQDAKDSQYIAGKLLESLFKRLQISELLEWLPTDKTLRLIPAEKLNKETAWYWRHLAEHLQMIDDDETLEAILPDLVVLVGYIRTIVHSPCPSETEDPVAFSTRQHVLHELGCMLKVYDASDTTSRNALQTLITDILTGDYGPLSADVVKAFVYALEMVVPDIAKRMEVVSAVISALRDPPDTESPPSPSPPVLPVETSEMKIQKTKLRVSLNVALEAQEEAVKTQDYALAAKCKAKVVEIQKEIEKLNALSIPRAPSPPPVPVATAREKASDTRTLLKCLTILNAALDTSQLKSITPTLQMIFSDLEVEIYQNPDIVDVALETVALYGMLDKNFARENKPFLFTNLVDITNEATVTTVLRCIVDLLCVHGASVLEDDDETLQPNDTEVSRNTTSRRTTNMENDVSTSQSMISSTPNKSKVIELLLKIMESNYAAYRFIIVEGLCRLLHLGYLESPTILSRLLLLWFNPATAEEDDLRQTIGMFFQTFPTSVDGAQEQIQKATLPTLRTLANAPTSSPLSEIDQEAVVRFIVSLTRVNYELEDSQGGMALVLCQYIVRKPSAPEVGLACRVLALLSPPRDAHLAAELATMLRDVNTTLMDKQSGRNLSKYLGVLEAYERQSLNKVSNTGVGESIIPEDTMIIGRATSSLPQPIGRSTHVVVNETVEEEVEIDEASPSDDVNKIAQEKPQFESTTSESIRSSEVNNRAAEVEPPSDSSSGVSPVKKPKTDEGKQKARAVQRRKSAESNTKASKNKDNKDAKTKINKNKKQAKEIEENKDSDEEEFEKGGIKRSRSQRSLVDVERARKAKAEMKKGNKKQHIMTQDSSSPLSDIDTSNVTVRRSTRSSQSGSSSDAKTSQKANKKGTKKKNTSPAQKSTRNSSGSTPDCFIDDSDDDTTLHTIVYDKEFEQELLNDSVEQVVEGRASKGNVTIPETPSGSEESDAE